jgi:N-acetylneuraminic acid mutarotase
MKDQITHARLSGECKLAGFPAERGLRRIHPASTKQSVSLIVAVVGLLTGITLFAHASSRVSAQAAASWSYTGNLNTARTGQTATLLLNGKVLIAGGQSSNSNSAELYDPTTGTWTTTGSLNTGRYLHAATLLPNGKVLVVGGIGNCASFCLALNSAELYDPVTEMWSNTGSLNKTRFGLTATLLQNRWVLAAGSDGDAGDTAELYDPATGTWTSTGNLNSARGFHTATLLPNGKVLVAGGCISGIFGVCNPKISAELYDPASGTWSNTGNLNIPRDATSTATLLLNGKVLVAGYDNDDVGVTDSAELYDPAAGTWSNTGNLRQARGRHTATLLPNGKVLVAAGNNCCVVGSVLNSAELYDPATGTWSNTTSLNTARASHTATLLSNGKVLVACGTGDTGNTLYTAELYDPGTNAIDDTQFFVRQHYLDFLNRQPDAEGLGFWTNEITLCGADQQCIEAKRINVSAAFFLSIEFQQTGYLVYLTYKASYGSLPNAPVPIKFNEFLPDTQQIGQGVVVNQAGWEQLLENNKQSFFSGFVQRSRFASAYPTSLSPQQFVDQLFVNAEVAPSVADRSAAINEFGATMTTSDVAARARALRRVAENSTFAQQEFNRAFVLMQYFGYLRRNPNDPPEPTLDFQGYNFWLTKLNQFNGNFSQAEMVKAFLVSTEYRQRFGQP